MAAGVHIWKGDNDDGVWATGANWISDTAPADAGDSVLFPAMGADSTNNVKGNVDVSGTALADFTVAELCYVNFGDIANPLRFDADYFTYEGYGVGYFNLDHATTAMTEARILYAKAATTTAAFGIHVQAANTVTTLKIDAGAEGDVGVCAMDQATGTFTNIQHLSGNTVIGDGATLSIVSMDGGVLRNYEWCTTLNMHGGTYRQALGNPTTLNLHGGTFYFNSNSTITTCNLYGGTLDTSEDGRAKNITTINIYGGTVNDPGNLLSAADWVFQVGTSRNFD